MTDEPPKSSDADQPAAPLESAALPSQPVDVSQPSGEMRPLDLSTVEIAPEAHQASHPLEMTAVHVPPEEPILPATLGDNALRDAVGVPPVPPKRTKREDVVVDDDGDAKPTSRRTIAIGAVATILGLAIAALVFLGRANAQRYLITCTTDRVSAEQGRAFPPWGSRALTGPAWRAVALPANAECRPRETDDIAELERWYLELLIDRASTTLTSRNLLDPVQAGTPNPLDLAGDQLNQALLLSRAPERRDQRKDVERLLGDVQYWRASLRLREASAALADAARQFDAAASQRPRHVTDAGEWASFLRKLVDDLHAGPSGVPAAPGPAVPGPAVQAVPEAPSAPSAPIGTALPVEPEPASEPVVPPDAGLPTGGVLL